MEEKFFQLLKKGLVKPEDVLDYEDAWHAGTGRESLHAFLGMTYAEYLRWMKEDDDFLKRNYRKTPVRRVAAKESPKKEG